MNMYDSAHISHIKSYLLLADRRGIVYATRRYLFLGYIKLQQLLFPIIKIWRKSAPFTFMGHKLEYFYHPYNVTWLNERVLEVPIFKHLLSSCGDNTSILEVGSVLGNYTPIFHTVVDKFSRDIDVVNKDILDFYPKTKYKLVLSISTMEHIGVDDTVNDPRLAIKAISHVLENCLLNEGVFWFSFAFGYNPTLDDYVLSNFSQSSWFFHRIGVTEWCPTVDPVLIQSAKYDAPFKLGNLLCVVRCSK
ncbi:hypothetical protein KAZ57_02755 [Patescibacteria group bacterium]|nr:hypothetical protein [Patescibacteria group bacterium]